MTQQLNNEHTNKTMASVEEIKSIMDKSGNKKQVCSGGNDGSSVNAEVNADVKADVKRRTPSTYNIFISQKIKEFKKFKENEKSKAPKGMLGAAAKIWTAMSNEEKKAFEESIKHVEQ